MTLTKEQIKEIENETIYCAECGELTSPEVYDEDDEQFAGCPMCGGEAKSLGDMADDAYEAARWR